MHSRRSQCVRIWPKARDSPEITGFPERNNNIPGAKVMALTTDHIKASLEDFLKTNGWSAEKDELGAESFYVNRPPLVFSLGPSVRQLPDGFRLNFWAGIADIEFRTIADKIANDSASLHLMHSLVKLQDTAMVSTEREAWVSIDRFASRLYAVEGREDFESLIRKRCKDRPDQPMLDQIMHLAALAYLGDDSTLEEYLDIFKRGFRLNFVPAITVDFIRRANEIAIDRRYS